METELFDWEDWDGDHDCMIFYNVTLKVQIGEFPPGTKFNRADIGNSVEGKGVLQLCKFIEVKEGIGEVWDIAEFRLHYMIGERITNPKTLPKPGEK